MSLPTACSSGVAESDPSVWMHNQISLSEAAASANLMAVMALIGAMSNSGEWESASSSVGASFVRI